MTNTRDLLLQLGVSNVNATIIINYMMMNPATTDPKAPPITLLIQHLQSALGVPTTGRIDDATNAAMQQVLPNWLFQPWSATVKAVVALRTSGGALSYGPLSIALKPSPMGAMPFGLPDVPGGILTYLAAGAVAYHFWKRR